MGIGIGIGAALRTTSERHAVTATARLAWVSHEKRADGQR
jgi:hypothetical protein